MDRVDPMDIAALLDHRTPLAPEGRACFAPEPVDHAALEASLSDSLRDLRERTAIDPFSNPLLLLALDITRRLDRGELSLSGIEQLVQRLTVSAFVDRARRLGRYLGESDLAQNDQTLTALIENMAETLDFSGFKHKVERAVFGVVLTAHPTFAMPLAACRILVELATGRTLDGSPLDEAARNGRLSEIARLEHRPPVELDLPTEQAWSIEALGNLHDALHRLHGIILAVARRWWPRQWQSLTPQLMTLASWVGYDHDGRADISWLQTLACRMVLKRVLLERHAAGLARVLERVQTPELAARIQDVHDRLAAAIQATGQQLTALARAEQDTAALAGFDQTMHQLREVALTDTVALREDLARAIEVASDEAAADDKPCEVLQSLILLRASLSTHGLGLAHTHVRLNATQLHNMVRKQVGLETSPTDPANRRSYFNAINELLDQVTPVTINMASLFREQASAKRMTMIVAQMLKYIDGETRVRFLIAETETGFTLLTMLYVARLFGVDDKVEISPLFETETALMRGEGLIAEALRSPHYVAYLRRMKRLTVQFGFSDSGRYMGQMAATFAIERLRLRLAQLMVAHGLSDIEIVLFNTHGDSIGRGGHPASLGDRFRYVAPPVNRAEFARRGIQVKEEVSFQGGDGYLPLFSLSAAYATVREALLFCLAEDPESGQDPVYEEPDFAAEFFVTIQQNFARLVDDPDYAALLGMYGANLFYPTGSRPNKRQSENWTAAPELGHPSQLRAIPNNSILQQLGMLANSLHSVGRAAAKDPNLFQTLRATSPRFGRALGMVEAALEVSDFDVLRAYIDSFDPGMWLTRSGRTKSATRAKELRILSQTSERAAQQDCLMRILRRLHADHLLLIALMPQPSSQRRDQLILLHALRVATLHQIYLRATHIPEFGSHHEVSREQIMDRILHLDVVPAVGKLMEIFPRSDPSNLDEASFAETASYRTMGGQSYQQEHDAIFQPLLRLFELSRRISAAITYLVGAVG